MAGGRTNRKAVTEAMDAIRDCALVMMENAAYIQQELPREMSEALRSRTRRSASPWSAGDVISVVRVDVLLESKADPAASRPGSTLSSGGCGDISRMQAGPESARGRRQNEDYALALVLLRVSFVVLTFNRAKAAAEPLPEMAIPPRYGIVTSHHEPEPRTTPNTQR
jgi:hypothetical protein